MLLSVSNIAWDPADDGFMIDYLKQKGVDGLEIAPTRIFPENPYDSSPSGLLREINPLTVSSIQSILYGKGGNIFKSELEYTAVMEYAKKAIDFAEALSCKNVVFGCPKHRDGYTPSNHPVALSFFHALGEYAHSRQTVLALEPNPYIYGTNFINTTSQAFHFVKEVNTPGLMVNMDLGTMIFNHEELDDIQGNLQLVNHIHLSEPNLNRIEHRAMHRRLAYLLSENKYAKFISIEMKKQGSRDFVTQAIDYAYDVFKENE